MNPRTAPQRQRNRGLSLIESLMAVAIAAVITGATLPGFRDALELRRLDGAAAQLHTDLQLARSEAVARNRSLRISYAQQAETSCYVVHTGPAGACTCTAGTAPVCTGTAEALRSVQFHAGDGIRLRSNVASMVLDPTKGTVSPTGTLRLQGSEGRAVHMVVNIMGRARTCSPAGTVRGHPVC
ncbi:GspH/FimT family pseudopilin [Rubrivivax rivuli]|nr:GspH/FimT family pseudopilin [Rubrivivax rivuli]